MAYFLGLSLVAIVVAVVSSLLAAGFYFGLDRPIARARRTR